MLPNAGVLCPVVHLALLAKDAQTSLTWSDTIEGKTSREKIVTFAQSDFYSKNQKYLQENIKLRDMGANSLFLKRVEVDFTQSNVATVIIELFDSTSKWVESLFNAALYSGKADSGVINYDMLNFYLSVGFSDNSLKINKVSTCIPADRDADIESENIINIGGEMCSFPDMLVTIVKVRYSIVDGGILYVLEGYAPADTEFVQTYVSNQIKTQVDEYNTGADGSTSLANQTANIIHAGESYYDYLLRLATYSNCLLYVDESIYTALKDRKVPPGQDHTFTGRDIKQIIEETLSLANGSGERIYRLFVDGSGKYADRAKTQMKKSSTQLQGKVLDELWLSKAQSDKKRLEQELKDYRSANVKNYVLGVPTYNTTDSDGNSVSETVNNYKFQISQAENNIQTAKDDAGNSIIIEGGGNGTQKTYQAEIEKTEKMLNENDVQTYSHMKPGTDEPLPGYEDDYDSWVDNKARVSTQLQDRIEQLQKDKLKALSSGKTYLSEEEIRSLASKIKNLDGKMMVYCILSYLDQDAIKDKKYKYLGTYRYFYGNVKGSGGLSENQADSGTLILKINASTDNWYIASKQQDINSYITYTDRVETTVNYTNKVYNKAISVAQQAIGSASAASNFVGNLFQKAATSKLARAIGKTSFAQGLTTIDNTTSFASNTAQAFGDNAYSLFYYNVYNPLYGNYVELGETLYDTGKNLIEANFPSTKKVFENPWSKGKGLITSNSEESSRRNMLKTPTSSNSINGPYNTGSAVSFQNEGEGIATNSGPDMKQVMAQRYGIDYVLNSMKHKLAQNIEIDVIGDAALHPDLLYNSALFLEYYSQEGQLNYMFSGLWMLTGYKHVITSGSFVTTLNLINASLGKISGFADMSSKNAASK